MRFKTLAMTALSAVVTAAAMLPSLVIAQDEQFIPLLVYRSGPYAPNGIPTADGVSDYMKLLNERDGGVNGVKLTFEECDTGYNNDRGVECYERLKANGPTGASVVFPYSTGITYALIDRATADKIPIHSMGYGRTDASDGRVFPYVFTVPNTYWSQASAFIKYVGAEEGGMESLSGKKIALVYHDSAYGKEPIKTLETLAEKYGYSLHLFPVPHPGLEQKATWLKIGRQLRPDWVFLWGWGVMNSTAIKEAASVGYPMEKFVGVWWSGAEQDVLPAGAAAKGYKAGTFHAPGGGFPVHEDIKKYVHDKGNATGDGSNIGTVLYNRGMLNAMIATEAIRTAQGKFGNRSLTGEEVRWGYENLNITEERLAELGLGDFIPSMKVSCEDHEGDHGVLIQQWDGNNWQIISDWISPMKDVIRPMIEASAAQYAQEKGITPRDCSKEG